MPRDSKQIQVTLPDGTSRMVPVGCTAAEALSGSGGAASREVLAVKLNGVLTDLSTVLTGDASLAPITFESPEGQDVYRHSSTHIMAQAVKEVFPTAQLAIGPAIEEGFYYDFAFERPFTPEDLDKIEARAHEIIKADRPFKRRDHRKLGKELDLITMQDEIGPGLVLWHPKGALIRLLIENFWREQHLQQGYELVYSPHIARLDLWRTSGHLDYYRENMFVPMKVEASEYQLKPMNCPFHIMIYKSHLRSYRDLPIRYGELGTVYRYERSGGGRVLRPQG